MTDHTTTFEKLGETLFCGICLIIFFVFWGWLILIICVCDWVYHLIKGVNNAKRQKTEEVFKNR